MFRRVQVRIALLSVSLLLVLYAVSSFAVYTFVQKAVMRDIDTHLQALSNTVIQQGRDFTTIELPQDVYLIYQNSFFLVKAPLPLQAALLNVAQSQTKVRNIVNLQAAGTSYRVLSFVHQTKNPANRLILILAENDAREISILSRLKDVIWLVGFFGALGATIAGFFLADSVLRPIRSAWKRQLEFVSNASHELRTPLAVIQSNLGIVMDHTDQSVSDNLEWLNNAHSESRRLTKLVQDLLTLARSDSEKSPIAHAVVNLTRLVHRVGDLYQPITQIGQIVISIEASEDYYLSGDNDRLHQLLVILLDNACKFTPPGGHVTIALYKTRNNLVMSVIDTGKGILPDDLPRVFERFYTGDESRARIEKAGTGLGLAIAKWIVEAHNGKISIQSKGTNQGTTVRVELPATDSP